VPIRIRRSPKQDAERLKYWIEKKEDARRRRFQTQSTPQKQIRRGKTSTSSKTRITISVKLDPQVWQMVKIEAALSGKEYSQMVEEALLDKLKNSKAHRVITNP